MDINPHFNKPVHSLTKEDLQNYFASERVETDKIEFKSYTEYDEGKKSISDKERLSSIIKTLCAFLNSDGGVLIWGAPIGFQKDGSKEKIYQGELTPVKFKLEPDQISNKISDVISPTPLRILFQPIELAAGEFCYVFDVVKSDFAPHQYKGTYYMRVDGATRPAPHHYVEALMKKISYPRIQATITFGDTLTLHNNAVIPIVITISNLSKFIHEKSVHFRIMCSGGDILEPDLRMIPDLKYESQIDKVARDMLHSNMPYTHEYLMITKGFFNVGSKVTIILTVWGELSPVIFSAYELTLKGDSNGNLDYDLKVRDESVYMIDRHNSETQSNQMSIVNNKLLQLLQRRVHHLPIIKLIDPSY